MHQPKSKKQTSLRQNKLFTNVELWRDITCKSGYICRLHKENVNIMKQAASCLEGLSRSDLENPFRQMA